MPVRPEDFGGVAINSKTTGPRPEDFGGVAIEEPTSASAQDSDPSLLDKLSAISKLGGGAIPGALKAAPGVLRGFTDLRERMSQLVQGSQPGDVYSGNFDPSMSKENLAGAAVNRYEQALGRKLSKEELDNINAEPDVAFTMATRALNSRASRDRSQFDKSATPSGQVARALTNAAPALALGKTPAAIAEAGGAAGIAGRAIYNAAVGSGIGASEFVQPGQSRGDNAAIGGAIQGGLGTALEGAAQLLPARTMNRNLGLKEALDSSATKSGRALERQTGVELPFSQLTLDPVVKKVESQVAGYNEAARMAYADHARATRETGNLLRKTLADLDGKTVTPTEAGGRLLTNLQKHYDAVDTQAGSIFKGAFANLKKATGDVPIIDTTNVREMLSGRLKELNSLSIQTDDTLAEIKSVSKLMNQFPEGRKINATTIQSLLSEQGFAAKGTGRQVSDLATEKDRYVAGMVKRSLLDDLGAAADKQTMPGEALKVFRLAREEYGQLKEYQRVMGQQSFGKLLNQRTAEGVSAPAEITQAPESVYKTWQALPPSQKKQFLSTMSLQDQQLMPSLRRSYFDDIFSRSKSDSKGAYDIDPEKLIKNWKVDDDFTTLFKGDAQKDLIIIREQLRRIADQPKSFGGGQSPIAEGSKAVKSGAGMLMGGGQSSIFALGGLYERLTPKVYSKLLFSPEGRKKLISVLKPASVNPAEATAAAMYINKIANEPDEE